MVEKIVQIIAKKLSVIVTTPLEKQYGDKIVQFEAGVDVAEVVRVVLEESGHAELRATAESLLLVLENCPGCFNYSAVHEDRLRKAVGVSE